MKIYLDDMRPAPAGWVLVKTIADFVALVEASEHIETISFDFDLGPNADLGGLYCLGVIQREMREGNFKNRINLLIHSEHPHAERKMRPHIERMNREWERRENDKDLNESMVGQLMMHLGMEV